MTNWEPRISATDYLFDRYQIEIIRSDTFLVYRNEAGWYAYTKAGARRKAARIIRRLQRREMRRARLDAKP